MHLNLRNKRWIFTDCISRVSVSNLFESFWKFRFDSPFIHAYKPSMMIRNQNEKVFENLPGDSSDDVTRIFVNTSFELLVNDLLN
jgi:hypothetical protein